MTPKACADPEAAPSLDQWAGLYAAAHAFGELAPWEWMLDRDVFGVRNPFDSRIGYCAVLGRRREVFALVVYLGPEGLALHKRIQSGELGADDPEICTGQSCLMVSFEDRRDLGAEDLDAVKRLGLKFRGRKAWPRFRSCRPGFAPWFLTAPEAVYLTLALEQAVGVSLRFREDQGLLQAPGGEGHLVRVQGPDFAWRDQWLVPDPPAEVRLPEPPRVDELELARLRRTAARPAGIWVADMFSAPAQVQGTDGGRPYFPPTVLWVDADSGMILDTEMCDQGTGTAAVLERFLHLVDQLRRLPAAILVREQEIARLLEPTAAGLGVVVHVEDEIPPLEELKAELFRHIR